MPIDNKCKKCRFFMRHISSWMKAPATEQNTATARITEFSGITQPKRGVAVITNRITDKTMDRHSYTTDYHYARDEKPQPTSSEEQLQKPKCILSWGKPTIQNKH